MHNRKVDFLVVGAQKSGTTALDTYLRSHTNICMGDVKELHYFDDETHFSTTPNYEQYHKKFSPVSSHSVLGEVTPIYMYWQPAMRRIWEYNPNMKIIVLLRNPIERAYSHWNMETLRGAETLPFSEAIRKERQRVREALPLQHRVYSYIDRGFYVEQLRRIYHYFPKKQILVFKHEELLGDVNKVLVKISHFLNLVAFEHHSFHPIHALDYKSPISREDFDYLKSLFFYEIKQLERVLDWDCSDWLEMQR